MECQDGFLAYSQRHASRFKKSIDAQTPGGSPSPSKEGDGVSTEPLHMKPSEVTLDDLKRQLATSQNELEKARKDTACARAQLERACQKTTQALQERDTVCREVVGALKMECTACFEPCKKAIMCGNCKHKLCPSCHATYWAVMKSKGERPKCPGCRRSRGPWSQQDPQPATLGLDLWNAYRAACQDSPCPQDCGRKGCLSFKDFQDHITECGDRPMTCPYGGCGEELPARMMVPHRDQCRYR